MPCVTADGDSEIYYKTQSGGPAVVFISSLMGITHIWLEQVASLNTEYRCIACDNRDTGRSDKPIPYIAYGVERHARNLATVLKASSDECAVLVGHSMSGNITYLYYLSHATAAAGIVFVGSYVSGA